MGTGLSAAAGDALRAPPPERAAGLPPAAGSCTDSWEHDAAPRGAAAPPPPPPAPSPLDATAPPGGAPPPPGWSDSYIQASVLVAHVVNLRAAARALAPDAELLAYHRVTAALDAVIAPDRGTIWKASRYELPYYCAVCPMAGAPGHGNDLVRVALRLLAAAGAVELPTGEHAVLNIGICTGAASAGIIGSEGMSFIVTGPAARAARALADCGAPLALSDSVWAGLGPRPRARAAAAAAAGGGFGGGAWRWAARAGVALPCGGRVGARLLLPEAAAAAADAACGAAAAAPAAAAWEVQPASPQRGAGPSRAAPPAAPAAAGAGQWVAGAGFVDPKQEAAFGAWHDEQMVSMDQLMLGVSLLSTAAVLLRQPAPGGSAAAAALLGPGLLLLLVLPLAARRGGRAAARFWLARREAICAGVKVAALLLRCAAGVALGAAPAAAAAAAAARGGLPAPAPGGGAGAASAVVWVISTLGAAVTCKLRLQTQLLVSALSVLLASAAAAHDAASAPAAAGCAVGAAAAAAALHCGVVYVWDCRLRAAFLQSRAGGGLGRRAAAAAAAEAAAAKAKGL
ncbi:MAG: hypothetical protein J3K34DRAFT_517420 [Monoraphidium minutum]|nr:MAG: hypothetical protein J3K34DRAFT_517420 [Monoraphidium minutum]